MKEVLGSALFMGELVVQDCAVVIGELTLDGIMAIGTANERVTALECSAVKWIFGQESRIALAYEQLGEVGCKVVRYALGIPAMRIDGALHMVRKCRKHDFI